MRRRGTGETGLSRREFLGRAGMLGTVAFGGVGLMSGCGVSSASASSLGLSVSHYPTLLYAVPWAVALDRGMFEERGVTLDDIVGSTGGGTTVRNVVTGGLPVGAVATPAAINAFEAGASLKILGGAIGNTGDVSFVTLPDTGIESIEDVRGKRMGYTEPGSVTQGCAVLSLMGAEIEQSEVELVAMGGLSEAITGLLEGVIDVAPQLLPTAISQNEEEGLVTVFQTTEYIEAFPQLTMISDERIIEEQPDLIKTILEVYEEASGFTAENPREAARSWANNSDVSEEEAFQSIEAVDVESYFNITLFADSLNTVVEEMKLIDLLDEDDEVAWDDLLDQRFLPEDRRANPSELR